MGPLVGFLPTDEHGLKRARRPLVGGGQALRCDRFLDILLHSDYVEPCSDTHWL